MVALNTVRTYRFVEGIWLHRKSSQIRFFRKRPILHYTCATCLFLNKYHGKNSLLHRDFYEYILKVPQNITIKKDIQKSLQEITTTVIDILLGLAW